MKKYLFKVACFIILFGVSNFIYLKLIQHFDWNFSKVMQIDSFENKKFDCLIIGNSLALDGFDMTQFKEAGIKAYNTAVAGATLKTNFIQLEKYLLKNKAPSLIILGLSSYRNTNFNSESVYPAIDYLYGENSYSYKNLPMIKFKWMGVELLKKIVSKDHRNATLLDGQLRTLKTVPDKTSYPKDMQSQIDLGRYEEAKYLAKIDSICLEHKIKLINIEMPAYQDRQNIAPIGPIEFLNHLGAKSAFYNLNNAEFCKLFDPQTDWLGDSHLNLSGSQKFTNYLFEKGIVN